MSVLTAKEYCITTFPSTHMALAAEQAVAESEIDFLIVPLPIGISASCGLGLKYDYASRNTVIEIIIQKNIKPQGHYYCIKENGKLIVTEIK